MPKFRYNGKDPQNLAFVGEIKNGDVFAVTTDQAESLEKHAPEQFERVDDKTKVTAPASAVAKQPAAAPAAPAAPTGSGTSGAATPPAGS